MPSNHFILCHPLLLLPSIFPSIRIFSNKSVLQLKWPKHWSFRFSISPSNEYSELISFRMDWLDHLAVQGTLKSLLQHHSSKASTLWRSAFFFFNLINIFHDSLFFFLLLYFTLQYCIGFAIHQHEYTTGVHEFPILNPLPPPCLYHPSGSSQCASPKHPVSCIETRLVIRFLHDSTCFNAILPNHPTLSLSHRVQKTVLYI